MTIVPFPHRKTPQQLGRDFEVAWADKYQLEAQPGSGNMPAYPLDVGGAGIICSLKHTIHRSISLSADLVHEMVAAARGPRSRGEKIPVLVTKIDGVDEPIWSMLESDALTFVRGEAGIRFEPSRLASRRAAAEPTIGLDDDAS